MAFAFYLVLSNDCETNAACEAVSNSECKENMCKCMSGYMMSSDTLCIEGTRFHILFMDTLNFFFIFRKLLFTS